MTKIVNLFGPSSPQSEKKPIQFLKYVDEVGETDDTTVSPKAWENVSLLSAREHHFDVMFAWDDDPNDGAVYLGHWNDGVVEQ